MMRMLEQLPQLEMIEPDITSFLQTVKFVPTASGGLRAPEQLYDPR